MRSKVKYCVIAGTAVIAALSLTIVVPALLAQTGPLGPKRPPGVEKTDLLVRPDIPIKLPGNAEPPQKQGDADPSLFPDGVPALEEILTSALQDNPDIRVTHARVREAEAALNQARLAMIRQAVTLRQSILQQQTELKHLKVQFAQATMSPSKLAAAAQALTESEAQLLYLMGRTPPGTGQAAAGTTGMTKAMMGGMAGGAANAPAMMGPGTMGGGAPGMMGPMAMGMMGGMGGGGLFGDSGDVPKAIPRGKIAEQLHTALDKETPIEFQDTPITDAIEFLADQTGLNIVTGEDLDREAKVTLTLKNAPLGAVLQALEDRAHIDFYVRDYGMLVTNQDDGPEDGLSAHDFWQQTQRRPPAPAH